MSIATTTAILVLVQSTRGEAHAVEEGHSVNIILFDSTPESTLMHLRRFKAFYSFRSQYDFPSYNQMHFLQRRYVDGWMLIIHR